MAFCNGTYVSLELPPGDTLVSFENRCTDNLPEHLLGEAFWQDHERSKEALYRIHTASQGDLSLEFINNSWFLIRWNDTLDAFITNSELEIPAADQERIGVRIWPRHDPQHPANITDEPIHSPEPETAPLTEEITDTLTLGVSDIAHIPDPIPFQPEPCQPSALRRIHEQVLGESSQGRSLLPQRITPAAAPPPPPRAPSRSGPSQTMALPQKPVSLQGTAPTIFTSERSLSETFMRDFKIYKIMNPLADIMKQPYARVTTALSLICGPKVDDWVDEQLKELEQKARTISRSDETLWTDFEAAFATAFTDTAKKEDAYQKLKHLKMKDELVDDYITAFNSLAAKAGWELNNAGTIDAFRSGLRPGTLNAIMNRDVWPETMAQWQQAAWDEMRKYPAKKAILSFHLQMGNQGSLGTRNQWQRHFGQRGQGGGSSSCDPNAMDVDTISTRNPLSEEEKKRLMAEGRCFFCKQQGHMS
jgi:Retrotransposon gag protein